MAEDSSTPFTDLPELIISSITMSEPNQNLNIYNGTFTLNRDAGSIKIDGSFNLEWFPNKRVRFKGNVLENSLGLEDFVNLTQIYEVIIESMSIGRCRLTGASLGSNTLIEGEMNHATIIGDKSIPVEKIKFSIPNLRDFLGDPVKYTEGNTVRARRSRLVFKNDNYVITIDQSPNFKDLNHLLHKKGGYLFLYSGEIVKSKGSIRHDEIEKIVYSFSSFLSFLNGRRCSLYVLQGIYDNKVMWTDFTPLYVDLYKSVFSWPQKNSLSGLNDLWNSFSIKWINENENDFLNSVIHWYLEANCNSGYIEGSIILSQIGLELIYNWFVIENKKLLYGKDAENISASNKIRLLLSQIGLSNELPSSLKNLHSYVVENNLPDGIEAFVQIRNALVHSQEDKRKKFQAIDKMVIYEANELGMWYLELSILKILNFKGKYQFRCSDKTWAGENEIDVPWIVNEA
jgi:hypothetical protein